MSKDWKPIQYKYVLLGDSSVGKTSIFERLNGKKFSEETISTIGTDKIIIKLDKIPIEYEGKNYEKKFDITLFDTAGQERYRAITKNYFKESHGITLIYDITNRSSFEHIDTWLNSIQDSLSDWKRSGYMIMILGNKLDIAKNDENKRAVSLEEAENICSKNEIFWGGECSAKSFQAEKIREILENFTKEVFIKIGINNDTIVGPKKSMEIKYKVKKRLLCC